MAMPGFEVCTKVLLTRSPLNYHLSCIDIISTSLKIVPFDLHALSTPPAFILDQDQILIISFKPSGFNLIARNKKYIGTTTKFLTLVCSVLFEYRALQCNHRCIKCFALLYVAHLICMKCETVFQSSFGIFAFVKKGIHLPRFRISTAPGQMY